MSDDIEPIEVNLPFDPNNPPINPPEGKVSDINKNKPMTDKHTEADLPDWICANCGFHGNTNETKWCPVCGSEERSAQLYTPRQVIERLIACEDMQVIMIKPTQPDGEPEWLDATTEEILERLK